MLFKILKEIIKCVLYTYDDILLFQDLTKETPTLRSSTIEELKSKLGHQEEGEFIFQIK